MSRIRADTLNWKGGSMRRETGKGRSTAVEMLRLGSSQTAGKVKWVLTQILLLYF